MCHRYHCPYRPHHSHRYQLLSYQDHRGNHHYNRAFRHCRCQYPPNHSHTHRDLSCSDRWDNCHYNPVSHHCRYLCLLHRNHSHQSQPCLDRWGSRHCSQEFHHCRCHLGTGRDCFLTGCRPTRLGHRPAIVWNREGMGRRC